MRYPKKRPRTVAIEKPISKRLKLVKIAVSNLSAYNSCKKCLKTWVKLGNIKSGKLDNLDVTSHIAARIAMKMIRLKNVVIPHFLL